VALRELAALERAREGRPLSLDDAIALLDSGPSMLTDLLAAAVAARDTGRGRRMTFSAKVFVPLTNLCRDYCGYCTFRRDPGEPGALSMTPEQVLALTRAGERLGAKEALFSLGDRPEAIFPEYREFLGRMGHATTLGYLQQVCELVTKETGLLPHANPGLMGERDLSALREVNVSMGIMLETLSERLLGPGLAHDRAPDKVPSRRLRTIGLAAIRELHERYGHIQEVIVQNFRRKSRIPMHDHPEPPMDDLLRTAAVARLLLGPDMNIQVPPNLSDADFARLPEAGINDWGGVSPLTPDHINPERPWPGLAALRRATEGAGLELRERLAVYPEYAGRPEFVDEALRPKVKRLVDDHGLVRGDLERWRTWN
jgi:2-iminoacetate synthase ThiH